MRRSTIFDESLVRLGSQKVSAGTSAEALSKALYAAADVLYGVRGSVRAVTTDGLMDAYEGYGLGMGPIPRGNDKAYGIVKSLRDAAQHWDWSVGNLNSMMEWLGKLIFSHPKSSTTSVKMIRFKTKPLGSGVLTEDFVRALTEAKEVLLGNMKQTQAVMKLVQAELKNPGGLIQEAKAKEAASDAVQRFGIWETKTKALAEGCGDLAAALKVKTASKRALYEEALTKLASMDDAKRSRFEEGKPADPTENMSPEDAAEWKRQNDKNKDNFKAATKFDAAFRKLGKSYTFDGACEAVRKALKSTKEADALIEAAQEQKGDKRSARDLAREFKLDDALGLDEAVKVVKAIQE